MDPKLPQGLVTVSSIPSEFLHETLSATVYKNLWRAYYTSRRASKDETEHRLEHLFWRIWSDRGLSKQMNTRTLDRLILRIKSPEVLVGLEKSDFMSEDNKEKEKPTDQVQPCHSGSCSIHPILKKPQATPPAQPVEGESHKSTRLLLDTPIGTKITLEPSNSPTVMTSPTTIPDPRPLPKKTYLTANRTGRGPRRRPVFNRRKSSQTSIPKSPSTAASAAPRRRSEPAAKPDRSNAMYEDSYVELGLLQHLSFRDEEDQIARDLGREIAPEPKPVKPSVPLFDEVDDDILLDPKTIASDAPFPRASSLKHPVLNSEEFSRVKQSFGVQDLGLPGGPNFEREEIDGDWTDVDALDSTLPISQPFKNLVEHRELVPDKTCSVIDPDIVPAVIPVDKHTPLMPPSMEGVKL
ncbi:unnamed protein product [Penicillium salamii]|uniref:Nitrogen regulatory protein areA GATA-like domain-containing protein n=1 Tax=Penicillium salamii TaxID=1612424 RepID=A0A9W4J108_9EURO|nr:unnamed protein product [Penicillium salamii]CAG8039738.1 unnamed protein product [Penicillium salamii]CAG8052137.1 unnamed protein product [Penicillium salamii]CAG8205946.1 unnamed protein product [Penicillium salamii]CAG8322706.1 unnamed protein product [Penicillium salamii]